MKVQQLAGNGASPFREHDDALAGGEQCGCALYHLVRGRVWDETRRADGDSHRGVTPGSAGDERQQKNDVDQRSTVRDHQLARVPSEAASAKD